MSNVVNKDLKETEFTSSNSIENNAVGEAISTSTPYEANKDTNNSNEINQDINNNNLNDTIKNMNS